MLHNLPANRRDFVSVQFPAAYRTGRNGQEQEIGKTPSFPGVFATLLELCGLKDGGAEGIRTPDLRIANATLSQLSYGPSDGTVWHVTGKVSNPAAPPPCLLPGPESVIRA